MVVKYTVVWTHDGMDNHDRITYGNRAIAEQASRHIFSVEGKKSGFMIDVIPESEYNVRFDRNEVEGGPGSSND